MFVGTVWARRCLRIAGGWVESINAWATLSVYSAGRGGLGVLGSVRRRADQCQGQRVAHAAVTWC